MTVETRRVRLIAVAITALVVAISPMGRVFAAHDDTSFLDWPKLVHVAPSRFDKVQATAVARNPAGVLFELRTKDGRRTFHCGERIQVQFVVSTIVPQAFHFDSGRDDRDDVFDRDGFTCDAAIGPVDPWASAYLDGHGVGVGDWMQAWPNYLTRRPVVDTMDLNDWVAFDRPGRYRLYAITRRLHRLHARHIPNSMPYDDVVVPIASTVLSLTIVPAGASWSHGVVMRATRPSQVPWDHDLQDPRLAALRYLRTTEAGVALLHLLVSKPKVEDPQDVSWVQDHASRAILESPYRDQLIPCAEVLISNPNVPISEVLLHTYARLLHYRKYPRQASSMVDYMTGSAENGLAYALAVKSLAHKRGSAAATSRAAVRAFRAHYP